jgi:hypothetical protein
MQRFSWPGIEDPQVMGENWLRVLAQVWGS